MSEDKLEDKDSPVGLRGLVEQRVSTYIVTFEINKSDQNISEDDFMEWLKWELGLSKSMSNTNVMQFASLMLQKLSNVKIERVFANESLTCRADNAAS